MATQSIPNYTYDMGLDLSSQMMDQPTDSLKAATDAPGHINDVIQKMSRNEVDLQQLLLEERMRNEQHRINFDMLKSQYKTLVIQTEAFDVQVQELLSDKEGLEITLQRNQHEWDFQYEEQKLLIEHLRSQVSDSRDMKTTELKIKEDLQHKYGSEIASLQSQLETVQGNLTQQISHNKFLRSSYETMRSQLSKELNDAKGYLTTQVCEMEKEVEEMQSSFSKERQENHHKIRTIEKEKTNLTVQIQDMTSQVHSSHEVMVTLQSKLDNAEKQLQKTEVDHTAIVRKMELEQYSLQRQLEVSNCRVQSFEITQTQLDMEVRRSQEELANVKMEFDDCNHKARLERSEYEAEARRVKLDLQRERDALNIKVQDLEHRLESQKDHSQQTESTWKRRSEELQKQLLFTKDDCRMKLLEMNTEIGTMESKVQDIKTEKEEKENKYFASLETLRRELKESNNKVQHLQTDLSAAQDQLTEFKELREDLIKEKKRAEILHCEKEKLFLELNTSSQNLRTKKNELKKLNDSLQHMATLNEERESRALAMPSKEQENVISELKLKYVEVRGECERKLNEVRNEVEDAKVKYQSECQVLEHRIHRYSRLIKKLRQKLEVSVVKLETAALEVNHQKRLMEAPSEDSRQKLREMQIKHQQFAEILLNDGAKGDMKDMDDDPLFSKSKLLKQQLVKLEMFQKEYANSILDQKSAMIQET